MITPVLKDEILTDLILRAPTMSWNGSLYEIAERFDVPVEVVDTIMKQFRGRGFVDYQGTKGYGLLIKVQADAHDYILRGGHLGEFEFLETQVLNLEKELESLKPVAPKPTFDRIKGLFDTVLSAVQTYNSFRPN